MTVDDILRNYWTGDEHAWNNEFAYLVRFHGKHVAELMRDIEANGIKEPILLGNDGRVWDGHHRLLVARILNIKTVAVEHGGRVGGE